MTEHDAAQQKITAWFDSVYARKGDRYLRPVQAYYVFLELLRAREGERLLDVACGLGRLLEAAREYAVELRGIDVSTVATAQARVNVPQALIDCGNAESLPYADATFDLVTCIGSLERMLGTERVLAEMRRVGAPGARYCCMVRNSQSAGWWLRALTTRRRDDGHAGANTLENWRQLFETNGFRIVAVWPDQYPLQVRRRWRSLFLRTVDYRQPIEASLVRANEFIFLMEKRP